MAELSRSYTAKRKRLHDENALRDGPDLRIHQQPGGVCL